MQNLCSVMKVREVAEGSTRTSAEGNGRVRPSSKTLGGFAVASATDGAGSE